MAELFVNSGQSENVGIAAPALRGNYIAGIDIPNMQNGLGLTTPWGSGNTLRTYQVGDSVSEFSAEATQLRDLSNIFASQSDPVSYDIGGFTGPQGPPGPPGPAGLSGVTTVQQVYLPFNIGVASYETVLEQLVDWGATGDMEDTLPYGGANHIEWDEPWHPMPIAAISDWNDSALDEDGSFMLVGYDGGMYVSTDSGSNWTQEIPEAVNFQDVWVSDASGSAIALDDTNADDGKIWTSTDYGANWSQVSLEL